ncbi:hypothetical protein KR026_000047, partial [Drosophila bipectinata]
MVVIKQYPLDNCQLFYDVKLELESYSEATKDLSSIIYFGGNETHVSEVCQRVFSCLAEDELIVEIPHEFRPMEMVRECSCPEAKNDYRGLFVLLLVNTATEIPSGEATWGMTCVHLVAQLPMMPQFLTVAIYLRCAMADVLEEFLSCGPRWVTIQYFETLNQVLGKLCKDRMDIIPHLWSCVRAAGESIVFYNLPEANKVLIRHIAGLLQQYLIDSQDILNEIHPDRRSKYLAEAMSEIMSVIIRALDEKAVGREPPPYFEFYRELSIDLISSYDPDPRPDLRRFANVLLDALQRILQLVSVSVYMDWVDIKSPRLLYNYQELICDQVTQLLDILKKPENSELAIHSVCAQLKPFTGNVKSLTERLAELTIGDLLVYLDGEGKEEPSEEGKIAGLNELFSRSIAFGNEECVWTMNSHLHLLNMEHGRQILHYLSQVVLARKAEKMAQLSNVMDAAQGDTSETITEYSPDLTDEEEEYEPLIRLILHPIFDNCSKKEKVLMLEMRDELRVTEFFDFESSGHTNKRIRFFNQLEMNGDFPMTDFLLLCYEKPDETWVDLARLAMTHEKYALMFWRMASLCARHSVNYMELCAQKLLLDERLLLKPNAQKFLLALYFHKPILNGLRYTSGHKYFVNLNGDKFSYRKENLNWGVTAYLSYCGMALDTFGSGTNPNYQALECILNLLMQLNTAEVLLQDASREQLRNVERDSSVTPQVLEEARNYAEMHANMRGLRVRHLELITKMMGCMDQLRWNLSTFDPDRVRILGTAVKYWKQSMPIEMYVDEELRRKIAEVVLTLKHSEVYAAEELKVQSPYYLKEFIVLVTQSSAEEATLLFGRCLEAGKDQAIWSLLSKVVQQVDCATAYGAFSFLFRRYMIAFRKHHFRRTNKKKFHLDSLLAIVAVSPPPVRQETCKLVDKLFLCKPRQRAIRA